MDQDEIMEYVRWWLSNLTEDELSEADMQKLMDMVDTRYPDATDCQRYYYLTVAVLQWLIREDSKGGTSGDVTKIYEKRGNTTKYKEFSDDGTSSSWQSILDDLEDNPDSIGCSVGFSQTRFAIGGANTNPYEAPYKSQRKKEDAARRNTPADRYKPRGMFRF